MIEEGETNWVKGEKLSMQEYLKFNAYCFPHFVDHSDHVEVLIKRTAQTY